MSKENVDEIIEQLSKRIDGTYYGDIADLCTRARAAIISKYQIEPSGEKLIAEPANIKAIRSRLPRWKELAADGETDPMGQMIKDIEALLRDRVARSALKRRVSE